MPNFSKTRIFALVMAAITALGIALHPHAVSGPKPQTRFGATGDNTGGIKASSAGLDFNTHKGINLTNGSSAQDVAALGQIPLSSSTTPAALGTAAVGTGTTWARADHVHVMPRLDQVSVPTASVSMNSQKITNLATPTVSTDAVTKAYADGLGGSVTFSSVQTALNAATGPVGFNAQELTGIAPPSAITSAADLDTVNGRLLRATVASTAPFATYTYANGTSGVGATITFSSNGACPAIDNFTLTANTSGLDTVLFLHGAALSDNGIYKETQTGDAGTPCIFTRSTAADTSAKVIGSAVRVRFGLQNANSLWEYTNPNAITFGTTAISYIPTLTNDSNVVVNKVDEFDWVNATIATNGTVSPGPIGWLVNTSGAAASLTTTAVSTDTEYGTAILGTGTTTTGSATISTLKAMFLSNATEEQVSIRFRFPTLSDGTNTYLSQLGLTDTASTLGANGVWIEYAQASDTHFRCTARASSSSTIPTPTITVTANQWYRWDMFKAANDTTLHQYIDGVECGTGFTTGQWPAGVALTPFVSILKSAGATSRNPELDYFRFSKRWPGRRAN